MKKTLIAIMLMFFTNPCFAECNYMSLCPRNMSTQSNPAPEFIENFAENILKTELKKSTGADFDVQLESLSLGDLLNGKFKKLTLEGKNIQIEGIYFSSLKVQTLCDYSWVDIKTNPMKIKENAVLGVWIELNSQDLRNIFSNPKYANVINSINLKKIGIQSSILYPNTITIENGKLHFTINATPMGPYKPLDISIGANFWLQNERIQSSRVEFINLYTGFDLTQFADFLSALNNFNFRINLFGQPNSEVQIRNIHIVEDKAYIDGLIFVPRN